MVHLLTKITILPPQPQDGSICEPIEFFISCNALNEKPIALMLENAPNLLHTARACLVIDNAQAIKKGLLKQDFSSTHLYYLATRMFSQGPGSALTANGRFSNANEAEIAEENSKYNENNDPFGWMIIRYTSQQLLTTPRDDPVLVPPGISKNTLLALAVENYDRGQFGDALNMFIKYDQCGGFDEWMRTRVRPF